MLFLYFLARKQEIIRSTELLLDAISCGDYESYTYVNVLTQHSHSCLNISHVALKTNYATFFIDDSSTPHWLPSSPRHSETLWRAPTFTSSTLIIIVRSILQELLFFYHDSFIAVLGKSNRSHQNVSIMNPHVHLLGDEAAVIAYVKVLQTVDK